MKMRPIDTPSGTFLRGCVNLIAQLATSARKRAAKNTDLISSRVRVARTQLRFEQLFSRQDRFSRASTSSLYKLDKSRIEGQEA